MWSVVAVIAGCIVVGFTLREIFHDLFHPTEGGSLSGLVARSFFNVFRRWPPWLTLAGPLSLVTVIFSWALLFAVGFAFFYWAVWPGNFSVESGMEGPRHSAWTAFYFSLEVMTTLGLGDIKPKAEWLRVLVTLHTLIG